MKINNNKIQNYIKLKNLDQEQDLTRSTGERKWVKFRISAVVTLIVFCFQIIVGSIQPFS